MRHDARQPGKIEELCVQLLPISPLAFQPTLRRITLTKARVELGWVLDFARAIYLAASEARCIACHPRCSASWHDNHRSSERV